MKKWLILSSVIVVILVFAIITLCFNCECFDNFYCGVCTEKGLVFKDPFILQFGSLFGLSRKSEVDNCETIHIHSYSGDIVKCRSYNSLESMPKNARKWCSERFELHIGSSNYKRLKDMKCSLVGMSSKPLGKGRLGCEESCDFLCCPE